MGQTAINTDNTRISVACCLDAPRTNVFFFLCGAADWSKGYTHVRPALYQLSYNKDSRASLTRLTDVKTGVETQGLRLYGDLLLE